MLTHFDSNSLNSMLASSIFVAITLMGLGAGCDGTTSEATPADIQFTVGEALQDGAEEGEGEEQQQDEASHPELDIIDETEPIRSCGFGMTEFACCAFSPGLPNESRFASGCAFTKAEATATCVGAGPTQADWRLEWGSNRCKAGSGGSGQDKLFINNKCSHPIQVAIRARYKGTWKVWSWYKFESGKRNSITALSDNQWVYYYAESTDGSNLVWKGDSMFEIPGRGKVGFLKWDTGTTYGEKTLNVNCP